MKKFITGLSLFLALSAQGQTTINELLTAIEAANPTLRAQNELTNSQKLEAKTENNLSNPTVDYEHVWGSHPGIGVGRELTVSQQFDFPTVYSNRSQIARLKSNHYDSEKEAFRQDLLLQAKELCVELVYLQKKRAFLNERLLAAQRLSDICARRLEVGDAGALEANRTELELLNARTEADLAKIEMTAKLAELAAFNGGENPEFEVSDYPDYQVLPDFEELLSVYLTGCPKLKCLLNQQQLADKEVSLSKANAMPKFELGYKGDYSGNEKFNGVLVGMSIPLFESKNTIKRAKAQARFAELRQTSVSLSLRTELRKLYDQAQALDVSLRKINSIVGRFGNLALLNQALDAGYLSFAEYFNEVAPLYQSRETQMLLERDYQLVLAKLHRIEL